MRPEVDRYPSTPIVALSLIRKGLQQSSNEYSPPWQCEPYPPSLPQTIAMLHAHLSIATQIHHCAHDRCQWCDYQLHYSTQFPLFWSHRTSTHTHLSLSWYDENGKNTQGGNSSVDYSASLEGQSNERGPVLRQLATWLLQVQWTWIERSSTV